jgi:hypothetical protein
MGSITTAAITFTINSKEIAISAEGATDHQRGFIQGLLMAMENEWLPQTWKVEIHEQSTGRVVMRSTSETHSVYLLIELLTDVSEEAETYPRDEMSDY